MVNFWKKKKVFVTGHTGFKGSWLSLWLQTLEAHVIGYALDPSTSPNLFSKADVAKNMIDIRGDICDLKKIKACLSKHEPEIIFHLAAQPLVRFSYEKPIQTYMTNVMGAAHILEAARLTPSVKAIVIVTSDKCYENKEDGNPFIETDALGGFDPYSSSKGCAELVTSAYRQSYFKEIGVASARAGNVIGGGDWSEDRLIPDLIHACMNKADVTLRNPKATRPWQHVLESLSGYLRLGEALYESPLLYSEAWNFGPCSSDIQTVEIVVNKVIKLWGSDVQSKIHPSHLHEAKQLQLDSSKAMSKLGWEPCWEVDEALQKTVQWYQACLIKKENMRLFTLNQIALYSEALSTKTTLTR